MFLEKSQIVIFLETNKQTNKTKENTSHQGFQL